MGLPSGTDVQALLTAAGFPSVAFDLDGYVDAALAELQTQSGYLPFVAPDTPVLRTYDPVERGGCLNLGCGLVGEAAVSVLGTPLTAGTHFWLLPANAPAMKRPFEMIRFRDWTGTPRVNFQCISVTARFGYALEDDIGPEGDYSDVWHGLAARAASLALEDFLTGKASLDSLRWTDYEVSEDFGAQMGFIQDVAGKNSSSWSGRFAAMAARKRRVAAWV